MPVHIVMYTALIQDVFIRYSLLVILPGFKKWSAEYWVVLVVLWHKEGL